MKSTKEMLSNAEINELIKSALSEHLSIFDKGGRKYKQQCAEAVAGVMSEFLKNYILVGYDFEGNPVSVICAHNALEADALSSAVQKLFLSASRIGSPPPQPPHD